MDKKLKIYVSEDSELLMWEDYYSTGDKVRFPENNKHPKEVAVDTRRLIMKFSELDYDLTIFTNSSALISTISDYIIEVDQSFRHLVEIYILGYDGIDKRMATFDEEGDLIRLCLHHSEL